MPDQHIRTFDPLSLMVSGDSDYADPDVMAVVLVQGTGTTAPLAYGMDRVWAKLSPTGPAGNKTYPWTFKLTWAGNQKFSKSKNSPVMGYMTVMRKAGGVVEHWVSTLTWKAAAKAFTEDSNELTARVTKP
jgi:hypothetical protein